MRSGFKSQWRHQHRSHTVFPPFLPEPGQLRPFHATVAQSVGRRFHKPCGRWFESSLWHHLKCTQVQSGSSTFTGKDGLRATPPICGHSELVLRNRWQHSYRVCPGQASGAEPISVHHRPFHSLTFFLMRRASSPTDKALAHEGVTWWEAGS